MEGVHHDTHGARPDHTAGDDEELPCEILVSDPQFRDVSSLRPDLPPGVTFDELGNGLTEMYKGPDGLYGSARITCPGQQGDGSRTRDRKNSTGIMMPLEPLPVDPRHTVKPFQSTHHNRKMGLPSWGPSSSGDTRVAILTSGGDAPGMNAAVRSCVAVCLAKLCKVFAVHYGYKGLVDGGDSIQEISWRDINDIIRRGGTVIGSARCPEMRTRSGRKKAAKNLAKLGVNRLVVIGGDGSLTGAEIFKTEWPDLLQELADEGELDQATVEKLHYLCIIGMVGSIDNDMCGFTATIGADTALQRIVDACDALITTAQSHQRTFIVEVMGRHCGYLALMAAIAVGADWVFVPECPPEFEDWETALCEMLARRPKNEVYCMILIAEGATDRVRRPISAKYLRTILEQRLGHDTRVTTLGHVQRGGAPSAYDRIQGTRVGAEAAFAILDATDDTPSRVVGYRHRKVIQISLTPVVEVTKSLATALDQRDFNNAISMRGKSFKTVLDIFTQTREFLKVPKNGHKVCIMHSGSPAGGMNAIVKIMARKFLNNGYCVYGARDGFLGLSQGNVQELDWCDVAGWSGCGGCKLGTNRVQPNDVENGQGIPMIANVLKAFEFDALIVIGGFGAFSGVVQLQAARKKHKSLCIPICCVPATMSNNVPGTEVSVGVDSALNAIVDLVDRLEISASSSRSRLFLIETMGGKSGFLAVAGALAGAADGVFVQENGVSIESLEEHIMHLRRKFGAHFKRALIFRSEGCSELYNMEFMQAVFEQEGTRRDKVNYTVRNCVMGHLQQGNSPTPLDRVRAARVAAATTDKVIQIINESTQEDGSVYVTSKESAVVAGIDQHSITFVPIVDLIDETDFVLRRQKHHQFENIQHLVQLLELNSLNTWGDSVRYKPESTVMSDDEILSSMHH